MFITFLTDFGLRDDFVGTCHGVIKRIAPEVQIVDITHGIPARQVLQGALVLANTIPYMPEGVHLAVVDPGVGGARRPLALRSGEGRLFVGPDNGLLVPAAERSGGVAEAHELANPEYALPSVSRTFHVDAFGNIQLNLTRDDVEPVGIVPGTKVELELRAERYYAVAARTFSDARPGDIVLYEDSYRNIAVAINGGDAAQMFAASAGEEVRIRFPTP